MSRLSSCPVSLSAPTLSLQVSSFPMPPHAWQQQELCFARLTGRPSDIWKNKNTRRASPTVGSILLLRIHSRKKRKWRMDAGFHAGGFGYPSSTQKSTEDGQIVCPGIILFPTVSLCTTMENDQAHMKNLKTNFSILFLKTSVIWEVERGSVGHNWSFCFVEYQQNTS